MGVIVQQTKNISLNRLKVTPTPGSGRMISLTADATHFVNCSGKISMIDCLFENQLDDATNVHGIYVRIEKIISPNSVLVKLFHPQQRGFDFLYPNTKVEITSRQSLMPHCNNIVEEVERYNEEYTKVVFKKSIPEKVEIGDVIASIEEYPEVVMKGCTIHNNRARGILLGSRNKILIENNYFNTQGAAILLEGDARLWFEQCGVRNLIVKGNTFDNCNYNLWGSGVITVMSGIEGKFREESKYNQNILIENNIFKLCAPNILYLYSVDGLKYRNNKVEQSTMYRTPWKVKDTFVTSQCTNIIIEE
jgi:parallel beta-helix repeat protein